MRVLDKRKRGCGPVPPSPGLVLCVFCVVVGLWIVVLCNSQTQNCMAGLEDLAGMTMTGLDRVFSSLLSFFSAQTHAGTDRPSNFRWARNTAGPLDLYLILPFLRVCAPACPRAVGGSRCRLSHLRRCRASVRYRGSSRSNPPGCEVQSGTGMRRRLRA